MIPNDISGIWATVAPAVANHLWQSTLFAFVVAALTLALRKNQARVRYWLWLAASLKFLIPFSLLVVIGGTLARPSASSSAQAGFASMVVQEVGQPFGKASAAASVSAATASAPAHAAPGLAHLIPFLLVAAWFCGFALTLLVWFARWRRIARTCQTAAQAPEGRETDILRRVERQIGIRKPINMQISAGLLEPGILGIFKPVLIWPEGLSTSLDDAQIEAILAHELWHVRRRDNLAAFIHMAVEAIFWFHPFVWWLGARLVEERERACDEAVVALGQAPRAYAESILKACEFCVASPLACVSGVTGADLKKRVIRIVTGRPALKLSARRKAVLVLAAFFAVAAPIGFGLAKGKPGQATTAQTPGAPLPSFEVASIKPNRSAGDKMNLLMSPSGRFSANAMSTKTLIEIAYHLPSDDQIVGAPSWVNTEKFDIEAKADDAFVQKMRKMSFDEAGQQMRLMVQSLLADRFNLKARRETQERPVYVLVVAKNGPKLTPTKLPPPGQMGDHPPGPPGHGGSVGEGVRMRPGQLTCMGVATSFLAEVLSRQPELAGRIVIDETGLKGRYDGSLTWTPEFQRGGMAGGPGPAEGPGPGGAASGDGQAAAGMAPDSSGPSLFTALQEQLGLRLKPAKGPVEVLVIDHIEPPSAN
ncbi:MAG TPA: M56 family metallopeptidase [Terriglobia bacterium]|nr:M56 family metallopeptidase [Terriglobia bacterium]